MGLRLLLQDTVAASLGRDVCSVVLSYCTLFSDAEETLAEQAAPEANRPSVRRLYDPRRHDVRADYDRRLEGVEQMRHSQQ